MIELSGIYKRYGKDWLFENFSIAFPEGQISVLIGPSGIGKTTILRLIAGLEPYEKGSISGIGQQKISFVFQEDRLLPWLSLGENIELVLKASMTKEEAQAKSRQVLATLDLADAWHMMPAELSGGMQRRGSIGRAMAYDGDIFLLDEPFKGLDEALKGEILPKLADSWHKAGKTVIMVTHDLKDARELANNLYELEQGRLTDAWCEVRGPAENSE